MGEGRHVAFTLHAGGARSRCVQFGAGRRLPASRRRAGRRRRPPRGQPLERRGRAAARPAPRPPARPAPIDVLGEPAFPRASPRRWRELAGRDLAAPTAPRASAGRSRRLAARPPGARRPRRARHRDRGSARRPRRRRRAGARGRRARAASRPRAARPRRRLRDLLVGGARGRPRAGRAVRPPRRRRPAAARAALALLERRAPGWAHLAWGEPELRFARRIHEWDFALRDPLAALYRALRGLGPPAARPSRRCSGARGRSRGPAALAGRLVRVLTELDLVVLDREGPALRIAGAARAPRWSARRPSGPTIEGSRTDCDT